MSSDEQNVMKYIPPTKLKVLMLMFFGTGALGIIIGLAFPSAGQTALMITFLGVINICLGGFIGWIYLTQKPKPDGKRKKKHKSN